MGEVFCCRKIKRWPSVVEVQGWRERVATAVDKIQMCAEMANAQVAGPFVALLTDNLEAIQGSDFAGTCTAVSTFFCTGW